jgi:hypothetical protein
MYVLHRWRKGVAEPILSMSIEIIDDLLDDDCLVDALVARRIVRYPRRSLEAKHPRSGVRGNCLCLRLRGVREDGNQRGENNQAGP